MTDAAPDPLAAELARIRELAAQRDALAAQVRRGVGIAGIELAKVQGELYARTPGLLAAVERVDAIHIPAPDDPGWCGECGHSYPCWTRRSLSAGLLGEESTDAH